MCVKDTGTKYQLWISDFNIDGTFTRVHPFIISHTKTMTRTREDGKEEVFNLKYKTSKYSLYKIYEPKERIIYRLPYYPDRIAHHAIMNVVKYIWTKSFIHNT